MASSRMIPPPFYHCFPFFSVIAEIEAQRRTSGPCRVVDIQAVVPVLPLRSSSRLESVVTVMAATGRDVHDARGYTELVA